MKLFDHKQKLAFLVLFFVISLTYFSSLDNALVSDDIPSIIQNPKIGDLNVVFSDPLGVVSLLLRWLAFQVSAVNPWGYRLINILFHLGNSYLFFAILSFWNSKRIALVSAVVFAVHPGISEAVIWVSGGIYVQTTFFMLLSFYLYLKSVSNRRHYVFSILSYVLAIASHPLSLSLVPVLFFYELSMGNLKRNWLKLVPFITVALILAIAAYGGMRERTEDLRTIHYQQGGVDSPFLVVPISVTEYLRLLFWPSELSLYHSEMMFTTLDYYLKVFMTLTVFSIMIFFYRRNKQIFFWMSFFLVSLIPTLIPAIFRLTWIVAERYLYLASLGIIAATFLVFKNQLQKGRETTYLIIFLLTTILMARTIIRIGDWQSEDTLWVATAKTAPSSPNAHNNLGDVYGRLGNQLASIEEFKKAIQLKPNYADAYHNLGNAYRTAGGKEEAIKSYQTALSINPYIWQSYVNIAAILIEEDKVDKAIEIVNQGIETNPQNENLINTLGIIYLNNDQNDRAKEAFGLVLKLNPKNPTALQGYNQSLR